MSEIIGSTYEVIKQIGAGGGGIVYLARHLRLNKQVVLKADKRKITTRPELLRWEVDILKDLSHPYIPQVYDFFEENGIVYTAMDFVDGKSLDRPLKEGVRFSQPQVIHWAKQLLQALDYLHSPTHGDPPKGYVHSDIKPANIMWRTNGDICLIDFNISLALGEKHVIGASAGYASPEHYGLDFSFSSNTATQDDTTKTDVMNEDTVTLTMPSIKTSTKRKEIMPDVRSDIYSIGATLYHLLSGKRPPKSAMDVVPLSGPEVSDQVAAIINRAMNPNPDLRYQTAAEMLWDFEHLHENDPRAVRQKRHAKTTAVILAALFFLGGLCSFTGLRQMQKAEAEARLEAEAAEEAERLAKETEQAAKEALEAIRNSESAYQNGDVPLSVDYALEALSTETPYAAQAQKALTDALGVYDLSDGFHSHLALTLPSEPLKAVLSPRGTRAGVMTSGMLSVFDTETGELLVQLPTDPSALSDVVFSSENTVLYAGEGALRAYDLARGEELWSGAPATGIALSADGSTAAAVYRDETHAVVYDVSTGSVVREVDFYGLHQAVVINDIFADPEDNLFALSGDGRWLGVSFDNGALWIFNTASPEDDIELYDSSDYTHFEGGFCGSQFAFVCRNASVSEYAVVDLDRLEVIDAFEGAYSFYLQADESGIYFAARNILVKMDPETLGETELACTDKYITAFQVGDTCTAAITEDGAVSFFDRTANLMGTYAWENSCDIASAAGKYAIAASLDVPSVRVLALENHEDRQVFSYDVLYPHNEARLSADGQTVMLFSFDAFRLYSIGGELLADVNIPDANQVYDQQYRRDESGSYLEVIYNDGLVRSYSAADGSILSETQGEKPDGPEYEEFFTDRLKITSPLHGTPAAYDLETGELIRELEPNAYLTYVTQVGDYIITEYISAREGERYGLLLDADCETLAELPNLCDILPDGTLVFDDMRGNLREGRIYSLQELLSLAKNM